MLGRSITKNSLILAAFAAVTAGLIAFTFQSTESRIAEAERNAARQALFEVVPEHLHDNDILTDTLTLPADDAKALNVTAPIHIARKKGEPVAFIIPTTTPEGYSGDIRLLVGVYRDGSIAGVRVVYHRETPGLGDKIEVNKHPWILSFDGKSLNNPLPEGWAVKKDGGIFDQFAGATITPRAIVNQVKQVLIYLQQHQETLLNSNSALTNIREATQP